MFCCLVGAALADPSVESSEVGKPDVALLVAFQVDLSEEKKPLPLDEETIRPSSPPPAFEQVQDDEKLQEA